MRIKFGLAVFCAIAQVWNIIPDPTKPPTPSEFAVIAWVIAILLIAFGIFGLVFAFRAPPDKHEIAIALEHRAFLALVIGFGIIGAYWFVRRFTD